MEKITDPYIPKNYGKEYCRIKGSGQYAMWVAVSLGTKPLYDDWIEVNDYHDFVEVCAKYDMQVEPDVIFINAKKPKSEIIGGSNVTTTFHVGKPFSGHEKEGTVHVFVSKSKESLIDAKKWGWYPVIVNDRLSSKPFIDNMRFGKSLGFPACCVDFFCRYNNWNLFSHPYEIYKNTKGVSKGGHGKGSYLCNNFLMDYTYFLIHHLPCSYQCEATKQLAVAVESSIKAVEPAFVEKTRHMLKKPLLVFAERNFIIFDGKLQNDTISYSGCQYVSNATRPEDTIDFFDAIEESDSISLTHDTLTIKKGSSTVYQAKRKQTWFMIDFE